MLQYVSTLIGTSGSYMADDVFDAAVQLMRSQDVSRTFEINNTTPATMMQPLHFKISLTQLNLAETSY